MKYSFSPVLFFYLVFRPRYRLLGISILPPLLGYLAMWLLVRGNIVTLPLEPFAVSRTGVSPGMGDLMKLVHLAFDHFLQGSSASNIAYLTALIASAGYAFFLSRQDHCTGQMEIASMAIASLMFFPHLVYDFVFLIVPIAACLSGSLNGKKVIVCRDVVQFCTAIGSYRCSGIQ